MKVKKRASIFEHKEIIKNSEIFLKGVATQKLVFCVVLKYYNFLLDMFFLAIIESPHCLIEIQIECIILCAGVRYGGSERVQCV